jgi:hypothetical protein
MTSISSRVVRGVFVLCFPLVTTAVTAPAHADKSSGPECRRTCAAASVKGGDGSFNAAVTKGVSEKVPGRGDPSTNGPAPGRNEYNRVEEAIAPACVGNTRESSELCAAATLSCPSEDQTRYWVWHRSTRVVVEPPSETVGPWVQEPGSFCLGPDDPGVPTIGRVIAQVRSDFQSLPLPTFGVRTDPAPQTLVNVPTAFSAGSAEPATFTPTILGTQVTITARPTRWEWTFGDGATLTTTTPGTPQRPDVAHEYRRAGQMTASVRVTWTGTFTLAGSPEVYEIQSPAFVQGPPTVVDVREARTQLVAR